MKEKRIIITGTGGHFTAALAVIEQLKKEGDWQIFWIGGGAALEAQYLPQLGIPYWSINAGKIQRGRVLETLRSLVQLPIGFLQSLLLVARIRPRVILSLGGYISVPVSFSAFLLGIPVVVHEQTTTSGLANRIVSKFAQKVAISHRNSVQDFPEGKTVLTGNPVRRSIWEIANKRRVKKEVVIYVTGGSRGSKIINDAIFGILDRLLIKGKVYHQTGILDLARAKGFKEKLDPGLKDKYFVSAVFSPNEVEEIYEQTSLLIARAGANTISELDALGLPAILVPIPWVEKDEQRKNARLLEEAGSAVVLEQNKLTGESLFALCREILKNPQAYSKEDNYLLAKPDSAKRVVEVIKNVVEAK